MADSEAVRRASAQSAGSSAATAEQVRRASQAAAADTLQGQLDARTRQVRNEACPRLFWK